MAVNIGKPSTKFEDILSRVSEIDILNHYFGIKTIPCTISSPLRVDKHPSFCFYSTDGVKVRWTDLSTGDKGGTFDLLKLYWGKSYKDVAIQLYHDLPKITKTPILTLSDKPKITNIRESKANSELLCKVREWKKHDLEYWGSYGISLEWLKYADIYPISHKIIIKEGAKIVIPADKYAYAYIECKEGKVTMKIYQPFNRLGFKWSNKHDRTVLGLWTKVPETGDKICICSSMKDALCLWANTGIPALTLQGEGYPISNTAIKELKRRFKKIFILLDNDKAGLIDGEKLARLTGFTNLTLPCFDGGKDIADLYKVLQNKEEFRNILLGLFNEH